MAKAADTVQLKQETLQGFTDYIREAEAGMQRTLESEGSFLWSQVAPERAEQIKKGTIAQSWSGKKPAKVPDGLIHDWIAATSIPGATMEKTLALIQDYDNHKNIYKSEVMDSKLLSRSGDDFNIYLRLLKKKIITVVLDTDHEVHYSSVDLTRWYCRSYTTRIAEVEDVGKPSEYTRPPDTGFGFMWRLNSYWRFLQSDTGVDVECRAISLTRDVPKGLGWMIDPIIKKLPKESLVSTLQATRNALSPNE